MTKGRRQSPHAPRRKDDHSETVLALLLDFQFVEEMLKRYLARVSKLIKELTADVLDYRVDRSHFDRMALGKLIEQFSRLAGDDALVRDLRELLPRRDYCAHQAFLEVLFWREAGDAPTVNTKLLKETRSKLRAAGNRLLKHLERLPK